MLELEHLDFHSEQGATTRMVVPYKKETKICALNKVTDMSRLITQQWQRR